MLTLYYHIMFFAVVKMILDFRFAFRKILSDNTQVYRGLRAERSFHFPDTGGGVSSACSSLRYCYVVVRTPSAYHSSKYSILRSFIFVLLSLPLLSGRQEERKESSLCGRCCRQQKRRAGKALHENNSVYTNRNHTVCILTNANHSHSTR